MIRQAIFRAVPLILMTMQISPVSAVTPMGWGRVNMSGNIIDTACAIETDSRDQAIVMATLPVSQIIRDGRGDKNPFTIKLVNCTLEHPNPQLPHWQYFEVTFDGINDGELFGIQGMAKGVALKITDQNGNVATPGKAMPLTPIIPGDMQLNYALQLIGNNQVIRAGEYRSTVRFKMDYY